MTRRDVECREGVGRCQQETRVVRAALVLSAKSVLAKRTDPGETHDECA